MALVGPEATGKTHLARAWAAQVGAVELDPSSTDIAAAGNGPMLMENADRADSETLFHLINMAAAAGGLLLTSRRRPRAWPASVPDLRSRLNALATAELGEPDDAVLEGVLRKLFRERSIRPADDVYPYLMRRIERSVPAARTVVERIDETAGAESREITRTLARQILESAGPPDSA